MTVYIGADHRGFSLKEDLKTYLKVGYQVVDMGDRVFQKDDDYVDFAKKVAEEVHSGSSVRGIVLCGSGVGVDITANKVDGIRCGFGESIEQVKAAREDDNINMLAIASDFTDKEQAEKLVNIFLKTEFVKTSKHQRRIEKIKELEKHV